MTIKACAALLSAACVITPVFAGDNAAELEMARHAIAYDLLNAKSPKGRYTCSTENYACSGPNKSEMALALLERIHGKDADRAIAALSGFKLDAHISETYTCLAARRAPSVRTQLKAIKPAELRASCIKFADTLISPSRLYRDLTPASICESEAAITSRINQLLKLTPASCEFDEEA